ncbi:MarR family winged helix-turn-helix transcriptional regulator [Streptomyces sp. NPDC101234]|uniref:MarR family winged helix-turn-helix transcriptional regulator n=1 Tax=Streptomyces sp. NPDC101234 TaxID=3366138 RepID=UPI0037FA5194
MNEASRRLGPAEGDAWRCLVRMQERLHGRVARRLQADSGLSAADYIVLVHLTEAPGARMRCADLARAVEWEKSRMSHQISRMVKRGLVVRMECPEDGRGAFVVITPLGRGAIASAAPGHVATVRGLFVDLLTPEELGTLARVAGRVVEQLDKRSE